MSQSESPDLQTVGLVEVLVDCPGVQGLYTYGMSKGCLVEPGDIISVPFGGRQLGAIAIRLLSISSITTIDYQLRNIDSIISRGFFSKDYWKLLEQVAHYYQAPLIQVIRTALPPGLLGRSQRRIRLKSSAQNSEFLSALPGLNPPAQTLLKALHSSAKGDYTWRYLQRQHKQAAMGLNQLLSHGWVDSYLAIPTPPRPQQRQAVSLIASSIPDVGTLTNRQQEILITLQRHGGDLWLSDALQRLRTTSVTLQRLATKGYLAIEPRERLRVSSHSYAPADQPKTLTAEQSNGLSRINRLKGFAQVLLHGVTGSGKTEVYLQAIVPRLQAGKSVLVLVPEIGLTPQLTDRFRARFGEQVCVYHSGLSEGERYDTWRQMLAGQPQVVIGTRSAIFSPLPRLGLIVLDEEHDSSFKQDQPAPCYHARTVARWRAQLAGCPVVLGSATPALETWVEIKEADKGPVEKVVHGAPLQYLALSHRVHHRPLPPVNVVDMRLELQAGNRSIFSRPLQTALEHMQIQGEQGLLFIHRRGHSRFVSCRSCGHVMECPDCDVSLAYHQPQDGGPAYLRCHYCGYGQRHPDQCPSCQSPYLKHFGSGTQRIVHELQSQFPGLRCLRFDSDTTRAKGAHRALLERFAAGEADVLVGTQMLTKGIDLPQITVVGVVAADGLLHMPDYWSGERAFQTLTQVAGRAGRGEKPGQVIFQTYTPEHPVIEAAKEHSYQAFIDHEVEHRQLLGYPPYGRLVLLRLTSPTESEVETAAQHTTEQLRVLISPLGAALGDSADSDPFEENLVGPSILGPTPAPILRVARRYRWHVLLKLPLAMAVPDLTSLRSHLPKSVRLTIDVDPLNLS